MLKVYVSYNMQDGKEKECQEYLANSLAPGLANLGFQFSEVWFSMWGNSPQILGGGEVESMEQARDIFLSSDWEKLAKGIEPFAEDFKIRLMRTNS